MCYLQALFKVRDGFFILLEVLENKADIVVCFVKVGIHFNGFFIATSRLKGIISAQMMVAQIKVAHRVIRLYFCYIFEELAGALAFIGQLVDVGQVVKSRHIIGAKIECIKIMGDGFIELLDLKKGIGYVKMGLSVLRIFSQ